MTNKLISLGFLAILLSVFAVSAAVTTINVYPSDEFKTINTGLSGDLFLTPITLTYDDSSTLNIIALQSESSLILDTSVIDYSKLSFGKTYTVGFIVTNNSEVYDAANTQNYSLVINPTFCSNGQRNSSYLKVDVDFQNVEGLGEDDEWYPLDIIEVEVKVDNKYDDTISDIVVEWCLYSVSDNECIMDDTEDDFNLKENKDDTIVIELEIDPDDIDENGDYKFFVKVYSEDSDFGQDSLCIEEENNDFDIIISDSFVTLKDAQITESVPCKGTVEWSANAWNIGGDDEQDVYVVVYNKELGINEKITIGDIDQFESSQIDFSYLVPEKTKEDTYTFDVRVYDEDNDVFEDDNDDEARFLYSFKVEGNCQTQEVPNTTTDVRITAELDSETPQAIAGEQVLVNARISNIGSAQSTYSVSISGNSDWSDVDSISPKSFTLEAGESKEVIIALNILDDLSGDYEFKILVDYGEKTKEQTVSLPIKAQSSTSGSNKLVEHIKANWFIYLIILINIILIIAIIAVINRMTRPRSSEI